MTKITFSFRINTKNEFPRLEIVRNHRRDGARYFGPFTSAMAARETWRLLHRAFPVSGVAREKAMKNRVRPACITTWANARLLAWALPHRMNTTNP